MDKLKELYYKIGKWYETPRVYTNGDQFEILVIAVVLAYTFGNQFN